MENQPSVKLLTIKEAAQLTRLHPNTIRNLIQRNELKADRIGRSIRINEQQLLNLLTPYQAGEFGVWAKNTKLDQSAPRQRPDAILGGGSL
jgi:excisionase family DNA binding protein